MQGRKDYTEKLFTSFQLSSRVPKENLYRKLRETLDLGFLYKDTKDLYGKTGNPSIDPVVFFKLLLTGYLENITSDRKLLEHCSMRMDVLYFLGFDIDEELPWHSTISRTRQLYPASLFETLFNKVFTLCVNSGMVSGHTQAVDSAPIKANASTTVHSWLAVLQALQSEVLLAPFHFVHHSLFIQEPFYVLELLDSSFSQLVARAPK